MSVTFNKPKGMKYTDMCIYIDKHLPDIAEPYANPDIEGKIYQYLYHIVYALACKSGYFKNFADYDNFACYAACELYISMRKKQMTAGTEVRGKVVMPIKSSLNFIKATMFPLKVNYQKEYFATVFDPKLNDDVADMDTKARENIQQQYRADLEESYQAAVSAVPRFLAQVIAETPFKNDLVMCKHLYFSTLLTLLNDITIPNKLKNKLVSKMTPETNEKYSEKLFNAYKSNDEPAILWHLDQDLSTYIRLLVNKTKKLLSKELAYYIHCDDLSDEVLDAIMSNAYDAYQQTGDESL